MNDTSVKRIAELITGGEAATTKMWLAVGAIINAEVPNVKPTTLARFNGKSMFQAVDYQAIGEACELVRAALYRTHKITTSRASLYNAARAARILTAEQQAVLTKAKMPMKDISFLCAKKMDKKRDAMIDHIAKHGRKVNMSRDEYKRRKAGPRTIHTAPTQGAAGLCNIVLYGDEGDEVCQNAMDSFVAALWQMKRDPEGKFQKALNRVRRTT